MLMTHPHFSIAIVDSNMLAAIGMQQILADIMPIAEVRVFASFEQLETLKDTPFVHYFVSSSSSSMPHSSANHRGVSLSLSTATCR